MLERDPPPGVSVWPKESKLTELEAGVQRARCRFRRRGAALARSPRGCALLAHTPSRPRAGRRSLPPRRAHAVLAGPEGSPYESGLFRLDITLSARYPFEPPKVGYAQLRGS